MDTNAFKQASREDIIKMYHSLVTEKYDGRRSRLQKLCLPIIKNVYEKKANDTENFHTIYRWSYQDVTISAEIETRCEVEGKASCLI